MHNWSVRVPGLLNKFVVYFFALIPGFVISAIYKRFKRWDTKKRNEKSNLIK